MKVDGVQRRSISPSSDGTHFEIIDQRALPHALVFVTLRTADDAARAIREMWVRGAPLIGAVAACGLFLGIRDDDSDGALERAYASLLATRPTAVNLRWALDETRRAILEAGRGQRARAARERALAICEEDVAINEAIGTHGLAILQDAYGRKKRGDKLHVLTHCNAGWLATVDWGTALAPIYKAHDAGLPVHVWVDETRPRNQGGLTAWELAKHGVPHTLVVDNAGGHLMQRRMVDLCIVGTDRVTATGDVCNKIGTYLKALAAKDNGIPFFVAAPYPSIDWSLEDGAAIPIEEREAGEVHTVSGALLLETAPDGTSPGRSAQEGDVAQARTPTLARVRLYPQSSHVANFGFDVTPSHLVTALVTERGACAATRAGLAGLYPERDRAAQK